MKPSENSIRIVVLASSIYFVILCAFSVVGSAEAGKKCPGKCMSNVTECKVNGGKISGYCTNELPCCDYTYLKIGSCGATKSKLTTAIFRSPDYPYLSKGDLICPFEMALGPNATGILVEFTHVVMDGVGFVKESECESDMFYFKGFPDWQPPAQCGNLTNYVAVIGLGNNRTKDMSSFKILALMSGKKYRWSIKITQTFERKAEKTIIRTTTTPLPSMNDDHGFPGPDNPGDDYDTFPTEMDMPPSNEIEFGDIMRMLRYPHIHKAYFVDGQRPSPSSGIPIPIDMSWFPENDDELEEEPFIVNGEDAEVSKTPWQASLRTIVTPRMAPQLAKLKLKNCSISEGVHFCGGSIISKRHILSASHCFRGSEKFRTWQNLQFIKVVLGDSNLCDEKTDGVQEFRVEKVYFHYGYDHKVILHDMVVIQLDKDIQFTDKIQKIKMAESGMTFEHVEALASGWGLTNLTIGNEAKTPEQLQYAEDMFIGNLSQCTEDQKHLFGVQGIKTILNYPKYENVFDSLICTYVRNNSVPRVVGQGDSGGPLAVSRIPSENEESKESEPILIGVISYMIPIPDQEDGHDVSNYVDFYQSVSFYRKWIDLILQHSRQR